MAFETREQVLEKVLQSDKPNCPHCGEEMKLWEVPPITYSDGLGWGEPYLFLCFNDECPLYVSGWKNMEENFGHKASYRCMCYPESRNFECMPVFSPIGGSGQVIDDQIVMQEEMLKKNIKKGFSILADCYVAKDGPSVLRMLLDPAEPSRVRLKAAEMMGDLGEPEALETMKSHKFGNELIQKQVEESVNKIMETFFLRECPFCAEFIKKRAKVCKHCNKEIAGQ